MTTYHERRYKLSKTHRRHTLRRRLKKLRLLLVVLGMLSLVIAVAVLCAGYFLASENGWIRWVKFSAGYGVFGAACFLVRGAILLRDRLRHSWRV